MGDKLTTTQSNIYFTIWAGFGSPSFRFSFVRTTTKVNVAGRSKQAQNDLTVDFQGFVYFTNGKSGICAYNFVALQQNCDFSMTRDLYISIRDGYTRNPDSIIKIEAEHFNKILSGLREHYFQIEDDFNEASILSDFWKRYAPRQRGRGPIEDSYPWGEVGEKVLDAHLYQIISNVYNDAEFVGLPYGHDVRYATNNAFVHIDIKSTGPRDNLDEVVSSPNQVSGDGLFCDEYGVYNTPVNVLGHRKSLVFQPELPPFYIINDTPRLTLTFYLKCAYDVVSIGNQPLKYLELICVPNGLLMFDTLHYQNTPFLMIPGKDTQESIHKRTRIRLNPLTQIAKWRCVKIYNNSGTIAESNR